MKLNLPPLWDESILRPYLGEVNRRHGYIETVALPNLRDLPPLRIESMFIQPLLSEEQVDSGDDPSTWPTGLSLISSLIQSRCLVLLGDPGSGKTTLSNWLAWRLSAGLQAELPEGLHDFLPIPCILRELDLSMLAMHDIGDVALANCRRLTGEPLSSTLEKNILARVSSGKFVLILDGADEIPPNQRTIIATWIRQAADLGAYCLATARIVGYDDSPLDRQSVLPNTSGLGTEIAKRLTSVSSRSWARVRYLMPFDNTRIASFVENWYAQRCLGSQEAKQKTDDLLGALGKSESMHNLARTPNLLSLMAIVHRERANLPDGRALLYKEISNAYINSIDQQRKIDNRDPLAKYSWEVREGWLAYVGFRMQLTRYAKENDVDSFGILAREADVITWLQEAMQEAYVDDAGLRAREFLEWIARRSGLLIPRGDKLYAFVHLSFQEYFCARFVASQVMSRAFVRTGISKNGYVSRTELGKWAEEPIWRESLIFFFELLSAENESGWVEEYIDTIFDSDDPETSTFFDNSRAKLAARLIANQHVHFSPQKRAWLSLQSSREGFDEWRYYTSRPERSVLKYLIESNQAIALFGTGVRSKQSSGLAPTNPTLLEDIAPSTAILILSGVESHVLTDLPRMPNIRFASITYSKINDLEPLKWAKKLLYLDAHNVGISDLSPLLPCKDLAELDISGTLISDISNLPKFKNLRILDLSECDIEDFSPLKKMRLEILSLRNVEIKSLTDIVKIKELLYLDLDGSSIHDISDISRIKSLRGIGLGSTRINDLSPLLSINDLYRLDIERCIAPNIEVIGELKTLQVLHFEPTEEVDISFLSKLKKLEVLTLQGEYISNIEAIYALPNLKELTLSETNFSENHLNLLPKTLARLIIDGRSINLKNLKIGK